MSDTHGSNRPARAVPDAQMHRFHAANAEHRHVAAFWAQYDRAPESPRRWSDAAAAYWRSAATMRVGVDRHESMYR
ncbi:hypothetical protein [Agromyces sp. Soil535]|uniref:hypothetical protein n=1 Tax=Agromyces sp. Soil535 TaxID=1736390 RepID=UPI0006F52595|nr:hypothetical protein [Agromyces sp. Soil535]KRE30963.1 hypothetical protein ASG80_00175 [Agromyces sp. Soil535]